MFFKKNKDLTRFKDGVFAVSSLAKADTNEECVNATIGSLYGEDGKILTMKSVFDCYNRLTPAIKASYAKSPCGNPDFREAMEKFILEDKCNGKAIAVAGGTGGITLALDLCLNEGDSVIIPSIAWGNYKQMLDERHLNAITYDPYNVDELCSLIKKEKRSFVIINSPCENPCGLSLSYAQWEKIINCLKESEEAILLNDIAYLDYAYDKDYKKYFELFNTLDKNVLVLIASSCSKTFSYYGQRLGALIVVNKDEEFVDLFVNQSERHIRTTYGSCNNGAQVAITDLLSNHFEEFEKEINEARNLLKKRTDLFIKEAKEANLNLYPYNEGFFVTIKYDDNSIRDKVHEGLLQKHIYCVKINHGIRVGLCSTPVSKVSGLARRIKEVEDSI